MRNLLRCRRGSVAFATVIALVPLIGVVALGAEAGFWYVIKQNAQNAADAAAYSGGLRLACSNAGDSNCESNTALDYIYRGKQFADNNKFCDPRDQTYPCVSSPPTGATQTVAIDQPTATRVRAVVSQQQPAYLAAVLGLSTVNIGATAIVEIKNPKEVCALGLGPSSPALTIGGSSLITGNGCALMSDTSVKYNGDPTFSGPGWAVNAVNGCIASAGHCDLSVPYNYNMLPATNPLKALDTASFNSNSSPVVTPCGGGGNVNNNQTCSLTPNAGSGVYSGLRVNAGGTLNLAPGTYIFRDATVSFAGTVTGTGVTLVFLGTSDLSITGTVTLSAPATNSFSSSLDGVLIDYQSTQAVTMNGGGTTSLGGVMYFPNADVSYGGNTLSTSTNCTQVIAKTLTITGNSYLSTDGCAAGTVAKSQVVALVQ